MPWPMMSMTWCANTAGHPSWSAYRIANLGLEWQNGWTGRTSETILWGSVNICYTSKVHSTPWYQTISRVATDDAARRFPECYIYEVAYLNFWKTLNFAHPSCLRASYLWRSLIIFVRTALVLLLKIGDEINKEKNGVARFSSRQ